MNNKAKELGLENTHFITPHGLDKDEHYTTAYELGVLTTYAMKNPKFRNLVNTKNYTVKINGYNKDIRNTNELLGYLDGVYGVKTGFTNKAGRCLVTATKRGELDIITVVLGADTKKIRTQDSIKAIEHVLSNFTLYNVKDKIEENFKGWLIEDKYIDIVKGENKEIEFTLGEINNEKVPVNKNNLENISVSIDYEENLVAPIGANTVIGDILVKEDDTIIGKTHIMIKDEIRKKNILDNFINMFYTYKSILNSGV